MVLVVMLLRDHDSCIPKRAKVKHAEHTDQVIAFEQVVIVFPLLFRYRLIEGLATMVPHLNASAEGRTELYETPRWGDLH